MKYGSGFMAEISEFLSSADMISHSKQLPTDVLKNPEWDEGNGLALDLIGNLETFNEYRSKLSMKIPCITEESLYRPEAHRWRERMGLLEPIGDVVVVIPCSMRKPYSQSKSHSIFMQL